MVASSSLGISGMHLGTRSLQLFQKLNSPSAEVTAKSDKYKDDHNQTISLYEHDLTASCYGPFPMTTFSLQTVFRVL